MSRTTAVGRGGCGRAGAAADVPPQPTVVWEPGQWPAPVQGAACRVVQEALTNAVRHAAGARIEVSVESSAPDGPAGRLVVDVPDGPPPLERAPLPQGGQCLGPAAEPGTGFQVQTVF
ncbi:hypothetical protein OHB00_27920 [Streptomyces sp. NBC_00631]|uniref:hypothetical protein n=1 Tax=Streptomyces sp. NBC_00631 TaxID=2975793 RepID=UPI0030E36159